MGTAWFVVSARSVESTRTRSSGPVVGFLPIPAPPPPTLSDAVRSVTVLAPITGSARWRDAPTDGSSAASASYSAAFPELNGNADATSAVRAAFRARISAAPDASGAAGSLTVVRLFRTLLLFLAVFPGR